jgi:pyridoxine/pyridoxamine 5'-phosphate oxidase
MSPVRELERSLVGAVRAHGLAVVATTDPTGHPEAALVGIAASDDGELLFNAPLDARKTANLARIPHVAVVVGWMNDVPFQIEGTAVVLSNEQRHLYAAVYETQHPGSRALHPDFVLYRVTPTWIRKYDAGVTPPELTEHAYEPA